MHPNSSPPLIIFTIIAKNYLASARVLMDSVRHWCPQARRVVILVDEADNCFDPSREQFEIIASRDIGIPQHDWFHFKYTILELSTAVKPSAFLHLFKLFPGSNIIYFDPDIKVYSTLDTLLSFLSDSNAVLTPHLTTPLSDNLSPSETDIIRSGSYNLGFLAMRDSSVTTRLLKWWQDRLYDLCVVDIPNGLFVDQKWMDLAPGLFEGIAITRSPQYNVAYWNLHERIIGWRDDRFTVNGEDLCFFHFSGYDPRKPDVLSKHQNRFRMSEIGLASRLISEYGKELLTQGYNISAAWQYTYSSFKNGVSIPNVCRHVANIHPELAATLSDPRSDEGFAAFVAIWNSAWKAESGITKLAHRIYSIRPDVASAMPDITGADQVRFLRWMLANGKREHHIDDIFLVPISEHLDRLASAEIAATLPVVRAATSHSASSQEDISRRLRRIFESRRDLRLAFPDAFGGDALQFLAWARTYGAYEYAFGAETLRDLAQMWNEELAKKATLFARMSRRTSFFLMDWGAKLRRRRHGAAPGYLNSSMRREVAELSARGSEVLTEAARDRQLPAPKSTTINFVGYASATTGVGESVRSAQRAAESAGIKTRVVPVQLNGLWDTRTLHDDPYVIFHVNADQTPIVANALNHGEHSRRYSIGYWAWELDSFPKTWTSSLKYVREIWTPSEFCLSSISR